MTRTAEREDLVDCMQLVSHARDSRGFTLAELMVVLVLVGVAAAIAAIFMKDWYIDYNYKQFVRGFDTAVRTARARAVALQKPVVLKCTQSSLVKGFGLLQGKWILDTSSGERLYYELPFNWSKGAYNVNVAEIWFDGRGFAVVSSTNLAKTSYTVKLSSDLSKLADIELTVTPLGHVKYKD